MNKETRKIIDALASDILVLAKLILDDDSISENRKVRQNTLKGSELQKNITVDTNIQSNIVINTYFDFYITYIEWTRPPRYGKQPPIDTLRDWAIEKGIPTDNSTLFLIARAIWEVGHQGRPIIKTLDDEIQKDFNNEWYDNLFNSITSDLTKFFS